MMSTRLPGKAIVPLHGVPAVERCLLNVEAITRSEATVLATSTHPDDAVLGDHNLDGRVAVVRGSELDVLERVLTAIDQLSADHVVRITGDCPVASYELADLLIESHLKTGADCTYPRFGEFAVGTNSEVYSVAGLRKLRELVPDAAHSEYLILYFKNNPSHFNLNEVPVPQFLRHPQWRLTLDEPADVELFDLLFRTLGAGREPVAFERVVQFFADHPQAADINADVALKYVHDDEFVRHLNEVTTIKGD
jgi:N,N'-diacetyllegionaminate synthase